MSARNAVEPPGSPTIAPSATTQACAANGGVARTPAAHSGQVPEHRQISPTAIARGRQPRHPAQ